MLNGLRKMFYINMKLVEMSWSVKECILLPTKIIRCQTINIVHKNTHLKNIYNLTV